MILVPLLLRFYKFFGVEMIVECNKSLMMKNIVTIILSVFCVVLYSQEYAGKIQTVETYNPKGENRLFFKSIWYPPSEQEYLRVEGEMFDNRNVAYKKVPSSNVISEQDQYLLKSLKIDYGTMVGYYYPIVDFEYQKELQYAYVSYLGIDVHQFTVHVDYKGAFNRYEFDYDLDVKDKRARYAYFRFQTGRVNDEIPYYIKVEVTPMFAIITAEYNLQKTVLTVTPKEDFYHAQLRKLGFYDEPLIHIRYNNSDLNDALEERITEK